MARTAKPDEPNRAPASKPEQRTGPKTQAPRTARAAKAQPAGRSALAKGPLGIVLAALTLVETIMGLVVRSSKLAPTDETFVIYAMVGLAFATLVAFFVVWIFFPGKLYPPSEFRTDKAWLTAVRPNDVLPSEPLPIRSVVHDATGVASAPATPKPAAAGEGAESSLLVQLTGELQGGFVSSTLVMELSRHLQSSSGWGYLAVDVGAGNTWLLSRLFIFVSLYQAIRDLRCIVLLRTDSGIERLLGIAEPVKICEALAKLYPWFNEAVATLLIDRGIPIFMSGTIDEQTAIDVLPEFVHRLQSSDNHTGDSDWSKLSAGTWEHTRWLNAEMVRKDFASVVFDPKAAFFRRPENMSDEDFVIEIMQRDSPFVALVGDHGEFLQLYDKRRIFEQIKNRLLAA